MKKTAAILTLCVAVLMFVAPGAVADEEKTSTELNQDAKRAKINEVAKETLDRLFSENANAKELYDRAIGWAVFDNTKVAVGVSGGGGNGVAVSKTTGKHAYMKMGTVGIGFGLGVNSYQVVFLFQDEVTLRNFIEKGWQADAGATASAGKNAAEVKTNFVNGLAIYQLTDKGLMLNADIAGTKYKLNDKLNE
jgi:lipid-binding SYLF domain-containing protein